jgi:YihY family inner membrane protein
MLPQNLTIRPWGWSAPLAIPAVAVASVAVFPAARWLSTGSVIATIIWIAASVGFSFYVENFGSYGKTYGVLAGVVVLLSWFWMTALAVLIGAEINA